MSANVAKKQSEARRITLKFPAKCKACGADLPAGSKVTWYPRGTVYGSTCHASPFASPKAKTAPKVAPAQPKVSQPKAAPPNDFSQDILKQLQQITATLTQHQSFITMLAQNDKVLAKRIKE